LLLSATTLEGEEDDEEELTGFFSLISTECVARNQIQMHEKKNGLVQSAETFQAKILKIFVRVNF
jgi:hypothetical protein